jgi:hypothetical protein
LLLNGHGIHTHDEQCNVLLTLVPGKVKQVLLRTNMHYIILVLILTLMYLEQTFHDTVTHELGMGIARTVQTPASEHKSSSLKLEP